MLVLAVGLLFMLLFGHALNSYLRKRDPLAGDVTLVFSAMSGIFVLTFLRFLLGDSAPRFLISVAIALLLAQPLLTLRLVSRFRGLPRWLLPSAFVVYVASTVPVLGPARPLPAWATWLAISGFAVTAAVAAVYFAVEAGRRTGSPRLRLRVAAASTLLFAAALVAAGLDVDPAARVAALLSAAGYVAAFMPPRRLREMWAMAAAHSYGRVLLFGRAQPTAQEVWQRFADVVHELSESDAVVVLTRTDEAQTSALAAAGFELGPDPISDPVDFALLTRSSRQRRINQECPIEKGFAGAVGARFATLVPLTPPYTQTVEHVALLLSRHRSLFSGDDLDVIHDLGAQAALLAGRAEAADQQRRLTNELAETVDALHLASKAKSDLLARVSHEFRTPLTAIIGYSALLLRGLDGGDPTLTRTGPDRIHNAGLHLLALVEEVLDLAKMDAGHFDLRLEPVDLEDLVARTIDDLRPLAVRKRLAVVAQSSGGTVPADLHRMRQVLYNLVSNAIKFTPDGGSIRVVTELTDDQARISVIDNGVGIPVEDQGRVFEEFTQVGEHAPHDGTGLGLSIARRLVAAHGGHTELESTPGRGSRFTISLPRHAAPVVPLQADGSAVEPRGRVLGQ